MAGKSDYPRTEAETAQAPAGAGDGMQVAQGFATRKTTEQLSPPEWSAKLMGEFWRPWLPLSEPGRASDVGRSEQARTSSASRPEPFEADVDPPTSFDRLLHASMARATSGISPAAIWLAYADWAIHLLSSPGKLERLAEKAVRKYVRLLTYASEIATEPSCPPCIEPLPQDQRFRAEAWQHWPFNLIYQSFLLNQQWWHSTTTGVGGVSAHHEQVVTFVTRQLLDILSPANFIATNPEVLATTLREGGQNLVRGGANAWADWERAIGGKPPIGAEAFRPGETVAVTEGAVVFRNRLIELIQYAPTTSQVQAEPVLIVPAWIMKYYILDLSPHNSLVKHLVDRGHTVFMISWHNPKARDRDLGLDDYLKLGILDAIKALRAIVPQRKINAAGYCLGGTLLTIAAAYLAREQEDVLNSLTLFAAQTDFTDAGELTLFIDDSQLNYLEDIMWDQGFLDTQQMSGAFQLLRSNDLIWSRIVHEYLMGQRSSLNDLMAWNADTTRLPYRMHSDYLRRLFLNNDLFEGRFDIDGKSIALSDIRAPVFAVSTERDHVAPWQSVFKIQLIADVDVTFVLASGGHNAGIISEPGHPGRHFRIAHHGANERYVDPRTWYARTELEEGSWWPAWLSWLAQQSQGQVQPPGVGSTENGYPRLEKAPGSYVLEQ